MIVSKATGAENYKIQCLSKILSNELTAKQKKKRGGKKGDIILKHFVSLSTVVFGLNNIL